MRHAGGSIPGLTPGYFAREDRRRGVRGSGDLSVVASRVALQAEGGWPRLEPARRRLLTEILGGR